MFDISFAFSDMSDDGGGPFLLEGLSTKLTVFLPLTNSDSWKDI